MVSPPCAAMFSQTLICHLVKIVIIGSVVLTVDKIVFSLFFAGKPSVSKTAIQAWYVWRAACLAGLAGREDAAALKLAPLRQGEGCRVSYRSASPIITTPGTPSEPVPVSGLGGSLLPCARSPVDFRSKAGFKFCCKTPAISRCCGQQCGSISHSSAVALRDTVR